MIDSFDRIYGLIARPFPLLISALMLWGAVPPPTNSATQVDLAQLLEQARAETDARSLRAPDGTPLCFPPAAAVKGAEAHVIPAGKGRGGGKDIREGGLSGYIDVHIEQTDAPVLLILRGYHSIIWRLHLSEGARLGAVHLMGYVENFVVGVPEDVPVTSRFRHPLERGDEESCVFAEHGPGGIYHLRPRGSEGAQAYDEKSFGYLSTGGPHAESKEVRWLRRQLQKHAGIPTASYGGWIDGRAEVSHRAIERYEAIRQRGRDWLAANKPPPIATLGPDAETMAVPEGLTNVAAMEWLVERVYAERTSRDIVEYLCGRRLALALLEGEDVFWVMAIRNCAERQYSSKLFTVLGPIRITEENCKAESSSDYAALLIPPDVELDWDHSCSWPRFQYPHDD